MKTKHKNINHLSSKAYYKSLKTQNRNLNSRKNKLNKFDNILDKVLNISYNVLNPIFKAETNNEYINTIKEQEIDNDFDKKVKTIIPSWLLNIFNLFLLLYRKIVGKKLNNSLKLINTITKPTYFKIVQKISNKKKTEMQRIVLLKYFIKTKPT